MTLTLARDLAASIVEVSHRYGKVLALDEVNLEIPAGCVIGLIGPDGVGKSTLLGLIAGTRKLQQGSIRVMDGEIALSAHRRWCQERIAYMPQGLGKNLYPELSVTEHLQFFAALWGLDAGASRRRADELLIATGLEPFRDRPMGKLSGGMRQKLGLCCALVHEPELLILDEPTTGIDPLSRRQFWELLGRLRRRRPQMTVLVATAYMREAEDFDFLAAMASGRILATGTPLEIKTRTNSANLDDAIANLLPGKDVGARARTISPPPHQPVDGSPAIEARGLSRRFGDFVAVDSVDLRIEKGEIFGFIGSNGCGKTTTMKMLAGLLRPSAGEARVFGQTPDATDIASRRRVGYMSQTFSLYDELTVRQNLDLHARLFHIPASRRGSRVSEMLRRFELTTYSDSEPKALPLGVRQRLSLAVALIHEPELLILDEPTSGVDPLARDAFWSHLIELSRRDGVTIFISTHFMNEAERCDRVSLMHAGRVLATGSPSELAAAMNVSNLEDAFVEHLSRDQPALANDDGWAVPNGVLVAQKTRGEGVRTSAWRIFAYAMRETKELSRDAIRLSFAFLGPLVLMLTFGFGISFDVENLPFAVLDLDRTQESREFVEPIRGSRYFVERPEISDVAALDRRLMSGELALALEIPAGFGRDMLSGRDAQAALWLDGAMPYRAETARGYVEGVVALVAEDLSQRQGNPEPVSSPIRLEPRMRYNQSFESEVAIVPGVIMLLMILIPAMMTALGVVREKEIGTIVNFHTTPVTRLEFLLGKQAPYCAVAMASFFSLWLMARWVFEIETRGSEWAFVVGALLFVFASTGFGLLVSSFVRSQMAAIFATAIIAMIPTVNFSGFLDPPSSLNAAGFWFGRLFPASYFQHVSVGALVKGLDFSSLWPDFAALAGFAFVFLAASMALLDKQER